MGLAAETGSGKTLAYLAPLISSLLREKRATAMPTTSASSARCCIVMFGVAAMCTGHMHALSLGSCTAVRINCELLRMIAVSTSDIGRLMAFWCCAPMQPWAARYPPQARPLQAPALRTLDSFPFYSLAACFTMANSIRDSKT